MPAHLSLFIIGMNVRIITTIIMLRPVLLPSLMNIIRAFLQILPLPLPLRLRQRLLLGFLCLLLLLLVFNVFNQDSNCGLVWTEDSPPLVLGTSQTHMSVSMLYLGWN